MDPTRRSSQGNLGRMVGNEEQDKEDINEKSAKLKKSSKTVTDDNDTEYSDKYLNPDADIKDNGTTLSPTTQTQNHSPSPARSDCASPPHSAHPVATILGDITTSSSRLSSNNNKSRASSPSNSNDEMPNSNHYSDINEEDECKKLEKCDSASDISNDDKESSSKTPAKNIDEDELITHDNIYLMILCTLCLRDSSQSGAI